MADPIQTFRTPGPRHPPQITVSLDVGAHVLNINRSRAGTTFDSVAEDTQRSLHDQLHPGCDGDCRFNDLWRRAWATLDSRDSVEWEVDDERYGGWLRLNLSRPPTSKDIKVDRRRRHALLTITDISKFRREYEALMDRYESLLKIIDEGGVRRDTTGAAAGAGDELESTITARSLAEQVIEAQESECRRIAADLHDGIAQMLAVIKFGIEGRLAAMRQKYPDAELDRFDEIVDQVKTAIDDVRRTSRNLAPSVLDDFGVCVAVETLCREFQTEHPGLRLKFAACVDEIDIPEVCKIAIYRVIQEALHNIAKHATATNIVVTLDTVDGGVGLVVSDDGRGFDTNDPEHGDRRHGFGMRSMRERVEPTGGRFAIESTTGKGTIVRARWSADALRLLAD
ncbi:MAG: histidine kinase [Gammaproteobacteria bacterium]|nr:histidine kinase [Gammaproteobacteria bacterium]MDH4253913.1 histidine kinase [Gammaproteobacteria bacterium]MDH5310693.1 histidine kinase [Gammaproteobacteria bacterium]